ncbi:hypothetical protein A2U01_0087916, partial [Trifolium medium]|nr:hypothetical protein [Trifolium medium]
MCVGNWSRLLIKSRIAHAVVSALSTCHRLISQFRHKTL